MGLLLLMGSGGGSLSARIQNGEIDGVYIDFAADKIWVKDSATPANNLKGTAASTFFSKAYTPTADGIAMSAGGDGVTLLRSKHNWNNSTGTYIIEHKADNLTQSNTALLSHNLTYPLRLFPRTDRANTRGGYRIAEPGASTNYPHQFVTTTNTQRVALTYSGSAIKSSCSGSEVASGSFTGPWAANDLGIGRRPQDTSSAYVGKIKSVLYTPNAVTDAQLISESTVPPGTAEWRVFLLAGQSNMVGRALYTATYGFYHFNAWQLNRSDAIIRPTLGELLDLDHDDEGRNDAQGSFGLAMTFSREYGFSQLTSANQRILFVPCAKGGTGFAANNWNEGDALFEAAVAQANQAMTTPGAVFSGILWHQGEKDVADGNVASYEAQLDAALTAFRTRITGATTAPIVVGGMLPAYVSSPTGGGTAVDAAAIQAIIEDTPNRLSNCAYASVAGLTGTDGVHFGQDSVVTLGQNYYTALATLL